MNPKLLPAILIVIDLAAAIGYLGGHPGTDWRRVIYWIAAAAITYVVTF